MMDQQDPLEMFLNWFLANCPSIGMIPLHGAVHKIEDVWSVKWFKQGPFQVQLFVVPPNYVIPEHTHPNVDSFEVYLGGQIRFSHSGKWVVPEEAVQVEGEGGLAPFRGYTIRVKPSDLHGGVFGPSGGVFMSVQMWLNGVEPHCVAADYEGVVMGPDHYVKVLQGTPEFKPELKAQDAASLEEGPSGFDTGTESTGSTPSSTD